MNTHWQYTTRRSGEMSVSEEIIIMVNTTTENEHDVNVKTRKLYLYDCSDVVSVLFDTINKSSTQ